MDVEDVEPDAPESPVDVVFVSGFDSDFDSDFDSGFDSDLVSAFLSVADESPLDEPPLEA